MKQGQGHETIKHGHEVSKLIRCILPVGKALPLLEILKNDKGIISANINFASGLSVGTAIFLKKKYEVRIEKEILDVVVPEDRADELFVFIFENAKIGEERGGFMYMKNLQMSVPFVLPDMPEAD
jgi:hypothetical protein